MHVQCWIGLGWGVSWWLSLESTPPPPTLLVCFFKGKLLLMEVNLHMPPNGARWEELQSMEQSRQIWEASLEDRRSYPVRLWQFHWVLNLEETLEVPLLLALVFWSLESRKQGGRGGCHSHEWGKTAQIFLSALRHWGSSVQLFPVELIGMCVWVRGTVLAL